MADRIEFTIDENGFGERLKINGDPVEAQEIKIHARAGHTTEVWIKLVSIVDGKVTVKELNAVPAVSEFGK